MPELTREKLNEIINASIDAALSDLEPAPEPEPAAAPTEEAPSEEQPTESEDLSRFKALVSAYLPEGVNIEEEMAAVYKSPKGEWQYRKPATPAPTQPTGTKLPDNTVPTVSVRQPGYAPNGQAMIKIAN